MSDPINPSYYQQGSQQLIDFLEHLPYNRGAAGKYVIRAGLKSPGTELEDLRKAQWYIEREIARLEGSEGPDDSPLPGEIRVGPQSTINISTGQPWEGTA